MYQFIESIYWRNNEMPLLPWHQLRFARTQMAHFGKTVHLSLRETIARATTGTLHNDQVYKVRVVYSADDISVAFTPYIKKEIDQLHLVENDTIDYTFKYLERSGLERMNMPFGPTEEAVIVKHGLLTDTTFTNIALYNGKNWETPAVPLLEGVQRAFLLDEKKIVRSRIAMQDLHRYEQIRLFNAMVPWEAAWELHMDTITVSP